MRKAFAHDALLLIDADGDERAPGAAITVALCGHWEHEPPCPLSPHHIDVERVGDEVRLRVVFVVEPALEATVRDRIDEGLEQGRLDVDGRTAQWRLCETRSSEIADEERALAARLMTS